MNDRDNHHQEGCGVNIANALHAPKPQEQRYLPETGKHSLQHSPVRLWANIPVWLLEVALALCGGGGLQILWGVPWALLVCEEDAGTFAFHQSIGKNVYLLQEGANNRVPTM